MPLKCHYSNGTSNVSLKKIVTDYTTSVGSLAYSNIVQANMHQFPNTVTKNVITHNHHHMVTLPKDNVLLRTL